MVSKMVSGLMKELMKELMKLWNVWDVEGCIIVSLMLQVFLVLVASRRKRNSKELKFISPLIWLAYMAADGAAIFSLGLLSDRISDSRKSKTYKNLLAFWAPFLLLHLGGPDTITAFALEDNELWLRNAFKVVVQLITTGYILSRSFADNQLLIPTVLMLVVGAIRYVDRIRALYLASDDGFKSSIPRKTDTGTNYLKLIREYTLNKEAGIPTSIEIPSEHYRVASMNVTVDKVERAKRAYKLFKTFKCIIADLLLRFNEVNESRDYLLKGNANDAFNLMDIELEFAYDFLYTKAAVVHTRIGYITRSICFSFILISFFYFFFFFDQYKIHEADIILTYGLLCGALVLDLISLIQLILSNRTLVYLVDLPSFNSIMCKFSKFLQNHHLFESIIYRFAVKRKRSMAISQYNLINSCLFNHKRLNFIEMMPWRRLVYKALDFFKHTEYDIISHDLKDFIFEELKKRTGELKDTEEEANVERAKKLCSSQGRWALQNRGCYDELEWTVNVALEESILLWHIATDLCLKHDDDDDNDDKHQSDENESDDEKEKIAISVLVSKQRHVSKLLSEYLLYLLICHPKMISAIEGLRQIKYQDAYEEVMSVFKSEDVEENKEPDAKWLSKKARTELQSLGERMPEKSNMVLFDACLLAKRLNEMSLTRKWQVISEVLVELLSFAASQCRGSHHAQALSRGGELITHVWFLMAHLGLRQTFHAASSHSKAKVTVWK